MTSSPATPSLAQFASCRRLVETLACHKEDCECAKTREKGFGCVHCPAHDDEHPSLNIGPGNEVEVVWKCWAGCDQEAITAALRERGLWPPSGGHVPRSYSSAERAKRHFAQRGVTVERLATAKHLPVEELTRFGVTDNTFGNGPAVRIPYRNPDGTEAAVRFRIALTGRERFRWTTGAKTTLYGLDQLDAIRAQGYAILVEGETDFWTAWMKGIPALGIPGKNNWKPEYAQYLAGLTVYLWQEPDAADLVEKVAADVPDLRVIVAGDYKDINEAHAKGVDVSGAVEAWKAQAVPAADLLRERSPSKEAAPGRAAVEQPAGIISALDLLSLDLPPLRWAVPDLLPEGLAFLAARPKIGKTWWTLQLALAVASGGMFLGCIPVEQGEVLYLALEDSERRVQGRLQTLLDGAPCPPGLHIATKWPALDKGGLEDIREWVGAHPDVRLVVIDTFAKVRQLGNPAKGVYGRDYDAAAELAALGRELHVCIVANHHTRKREAVDPFDTVSGSLGLTGAADTVLVMQRDRGQTRATLHLTGRDVDERQLVIEQDTTTSRWQLVGDVEEFQRSPERNSILAALHNPGPMTPAQLADFLGKNVNTVKTLLRKMAAAGEVKSVNGVYHPLDPPPGQRGDAVNPVNPVNRGNPVNRVNRQATTGATQFTEFTGLQAALDAAVRTGNELTEAVTPTAPGVSGDARLSTAPAEAAPRVHQPPRPARITQDMGRRPNGADEWRKYVSDGGCGCAEPGCYLGVRYRDGLGLEWCPKHRGRATLGKWAAGRDFPRVEVLGHVIDSGEEGWRQFLRTSSRDQRQQATKLMRAPEGSA